MDDRSSLRPVVASAAIADLLTGRPRDAAVLAVFDAAAYLDTDDRVVALVARDGVHQPQACVLDQPITDRPFAHVTRGQRFTLGHGLIDGPLRLRVSRWWNPVPVLPQVPLEDLVHRGGQLRAAIGPHELTGLADELALALARGDGSEACDLADRLIGWGPGLTPAGDDVLAGLLSAAWLLPASVGLAAAPWLDDLGDYIVHRSAGRTTRLSTALLDHARRGEMAAPAGSVLRALAGRGALDRAVPELLRVGATSGHDLATGMAAAVTILRPTPHPESKR